MDFSTAHHRIVKILSKMALFFLQKFSFSPQNGQKRSNIFMKIAYIGKKYGQKWTKIIKKTVKNAIIVEKTVIFSHIFAYIVGFMAIFTHFCTTSHTFDKNRQKKQAKSDLF